MLGEGSEQEALGAWKEGEINLAVKVDLLVFSLMSISLRCI